MKYLTLKAVENILLPIMERGNTMLKFLKYIDLNMERKSPSSEYSLSLMPEKIYLPMGVSLTQCRKILQVLTFHGLLQREHRFSPVYAVHENFVAFINEHAHE